jgi:hypothetical protein
MIEREEPEPEDTVADLEHRGDQVAGEIDETRQDWEAKQGDQSVPGAQPEPGGDVVRIENDEGEEPGEEPAEDSGDEG